MSGTQKKYTVDDQHQLRDFVHGAAARSSDGGALFDSAGAAKAGLDAMHNTPGATPGVLSELLGNVKEEDEAGIVGAIFDGAAAYEREHGFRPQGDILLSAVAQANALFDSATNAHHDQISLAPAPPIVAILSALAEACPFAGYLPADRGSNEARLIIVTHQAGSTWGGYTQGDLMDGIACGSPYFASSRTADLSSADADGNYAFAFTATPTAGAPLKLLRGRTIVYVNGLIAAAEVGNGPSTAASVPIAGAFTLAGVQYSLSGTISPGAGTVTVKPSAALPAGTVVTAEVFVDYEADASVTPEMQVQAMVYQMFASPYRANYRITPESRSQFANEVGVDAGSEAMMAVRGQYSMERHYQAIYKAKRIGKFQNLSQYDFQYAEQIQQKTRAQIWQDFQAVLGRASQKMAEDTADHGITHLYVTKAVLAQFRSMPADLWQGSGIVDRPGIFRAGRLFGQYDVYYTPKGLIEADDGSSAEILAVGRSTQTARCPIIFGDASSPLFEPLGMGLDQKTGYGFNARSFTSQNPHEMSAKGAALIEVINLK